MRTHPKNKKILEKIESDGFTLIEVLAGMLISIIFVLITFQAIAIAALYRVRAQRESEALLWIQENFEDIKFASIQQIPENPATPPPCNATDANSGFAQALAGKITGDLNVTLPSVQSFGGNDVVLLNKSYAATRTLSAYGDAPFNILAVSYSITDPESTVASSLNNEISTFYTEVIPDAAFNCD